MTANLYPHVDGVSTQLILNWRGKGRAFRRVAAPCGALVYQWKGIHVQVGAPHYVEGCTCTICRAKIGDGTKFFAFAVAGPQEAVSQLEDDFDSYLSYHRHASPLPAKGSEDSLADDNSRCSKCGEPPTSEGHDRCLGTLPGVMNACCGHGRDSGAYVQMCDGSWLGGDAALQQMHDMKQSAPHSACGLCPAAAVIAVGRRLR